jgi:hypothetical protein
VPPSAADAKALQQSRYPEIGPEIASWLRGRSPEELARLVDGITESLESPILV